MTIPLPIMCPELGLLEYSHTHGDLHYFSYWGVRGRKSGDIGLFAYRFTGSICTDPNFGRKSIVNLGGLLDILRHAEKTNAK